MTPAAAAAGAHGPLEGPPQNAATAASEPEPAARALRSGTGFAPLVFCVLAIIAALYLGRAFFVPLLIGILASYTLHPVVDVLHAARIPRAIAAALVLAVLIGGASWIGYSVSDEAAVMIEKLPDAARRLRHIMSSAGNMTPSALQNVQEAASELQGAAADASRKPGARVSPVQAPEAAPSWLRDYALAQSGLLVSVAAQTPIVLLLAYFLLASGDHFRRKLLQLVGPSLSRKKDALRILEEIDSQVQRYLFVTLASNVLIAISTYLAFKALGVGQPLAWGVFAGVLHFIPYLGPLLVAVAAGVAAFVQFGSPLHAVAVAGAAVAISAVIGMGFMTWLQGRFARVNAAVLFIALLFFAWLWGAAGLLLGAPLVAIAKVICDRVEALNPMGDLLGR